MPAWFLVPVMIELNVLGLGVWSDHFANITNLVDGMQSGLWPEKTTLSPMALSAREKRRAPQSVKMALETLGQASTQAGIATEKTPVVMASSMGDMEITDYMCSLLSTEPRLVSPTTFHNSVHNAAVGYWSISQSSHAACTAVAAGEYSGPAGLFEAVSICLDEHAPVLFVIQESKAVDKLLPLCNSPHALSLAMVLAPADCGESLARLNLRAEQSPAEWPALKPFLADNYGENPAGKMLPLLLALSGQGSATGGGATEQNFRFPLSPFGSLQLKVTMGERK